MTLQVLDALIQDLLDGCIDPGGLRYLEHELISNPQALARYLAFADLHGLLDLQSLMDDQMKSPDVLGVMKTPVTVRRFPVASILSIAAVLIVVGVALKLIFVGNDPEFRVSKHSRYTLTDKDGEMIRGRNSLKEGSRLALEQGSMEINFNSGVRGVIVAPADLTLQKPGTLSVKQGTAWFHVPHNAVGFRVSTPRMEVVDLGTEFGVRSIDGRPDEVHVISGRVRVESAGGSRMTETLSAGQARRIASNGDLLPIAESPGDFVDVLPAKLPHLHWSFDELDGGLLAASGTFPSTAAIRNRLIQTAPGDRLVPGKFEMALSLDGKGDHVISDWPGFAGNRPRTVSFWMKLPSNGDYRTSGGILSWGNETAYSLNAKWKIRMIQSSPGGPSVLRLSWGATWLDGSTPLADDQWHHIVVTTTGLVNAAGQPHGELYVDSHKEQARYDGELNLAVIPPMNTDIVTQNATPLLIGSSHNPFDRPRYFNGEIDELTIFDGYIPEEQISTLTTD